MMSRRPLLGILWLLGTSAALAQVTPAGTALVAPRLLTPREGRVIINAAQRRQQQTNQKPDCSHLVHEVYVLAGYPYPYADSSQLYAGISSFIRVWKPQLGDLVVWPGHVGIVVDPREHSFYSSVRSGLHTEFYDTPDWRARGPARFYRYATDRPANFALTNQKVPGATTEPVRLAAPLPDGLGTVGGQVLDTSGKPVWGARVTVQASDGRNLQTTETNGQGHFWFASLPEGGYDVRAVYRERVSEWRQNVWVVPGRQTNVILHLRQRRSRLTAESNSTAVLESRIATQL